MAIEVLPAAYAALKLGQDGKSSLDEGIFNGHDVTHWSSHLLVAGTIIGVISLIAGILLNQLAIAIQGGILFVTNGIGSYYISKFSTFHNAGELIEAMRLRIHSFWEQIVNLQKQVQRSELGRKQLQLAVTKIEKILKEKEKINQDQLHTIKDLEHVQKKLTQISHVYQPLKNAVDQFLIATSQLSTSEHFLEDNLATLLENIKALGNVRNTLKAEIDSISTETNKISSEKLNIEQSLQVLDKILKNLPKHHANLKEVNKNLKEEINNLQLCIANLEKNNNDFSEIKDHFEKEILPTLKNGLPSKTELENMITTLKKKLDSK